MNERSTPVWPRLATGLAFLVVLTLPAAPAVAQTADGYGPFVDTDGSIHEPGVSAIWHAGLTNGCAEWRYCPHGSVTRAELAAFLTRALSIPLGDGSHYRDAMGHRFEGEIAALTAAGLAQGCASDLFCPDRLVTRGEMAAFLAAALSLPASSSPDRFTDDDGTIHEDDIDRIAEAGISDGCGGSRFCPHGAVTRAEMATLLTRGLGLPVPDAVPAIPTDETIDYRLETAPPATGAESWRWLVELYFLPADVDHAVDVMDCESKGDPNAVNPASGASGLFQHMPRYWAERSEAAGFAGASIFEPEANIGVAAWLVYEHTGWVHWVCAW